MRLPKKSDLPKDLLDAGRFILWFEEKRGDKLMKIPVAPWKTGHWKATSATNPENWTDFETAMRYARERDNYGIGFVFSNDDDIVGIDIDNCINGEGIVEEWALEIFNKANSYTEISPSGKGLHIFLKGNIPNAIKPPNEKIEVYDQARFFTLTGRRQKDVRVLRKKQELLDELWGKYGNKPPKVASEARQSNVNIPITEIVPIKNLERRGKQYQGPHPIHGSDNTGMNFTVNPEKNTWYCHHAGHECGGGPFEYIAMEEGIIECGEWRRGEGPLKGEKWIQTVEATERRGYITPEEASELVGERKKEQEVRSTVKLTDKEAEIAFEDLTRAKDETRGTFYAKVEDSGVYFEENWKLSNRNLNEFISRIVENENLNSGERETLQQSFSELRRKARERIKAKQKKEERKREPTEEVPFSEKFDQALEEAYEETQNVELHPVIDYHNDIGASLGISLPLEGQSKEAIITEKSLFARNNSVQLLKGEIPNNPISIRPIDTPFVSDFTYREILKLVVEARKNGRIGKEADSREIFEEVSGKVAYYWWHIDTRWRTALTCWIIGTYFFPIFPAYPIWVAQGERETGKTTSLKVIHLLGWNPTKIETNLRPAPLFRTIEGGRPTFLVDVTKLPKEQRIELQDIAESGFEKDGSVRRCIGDDNSPVDFTTYCPKGFATRRDLPFDAKAIKCITRTPEEAEDRIKYTERWTELPDDPNRAKIVKNLLKLMLTEWKRVLNAYESIEQTEDLMGRRFTIWRPLLAVCRSFAEDEYDELLELAKKDAAQMQATDFTYEVENAVIGYLLDKVSARGDFSVLLSGNNSLTKGVREIMGQDVAWQTVRSALNNLSIVKKGYSTSRGKKYQIDSEELRKRAEAREIRLEESAGTGEVGQLGGLDGFGDKCHFCGDPATMYARDGTALCNDCAEDYEGDL